MIIDYSAVDPLTHFLAKVLNLPLSFYCFYFFIKCEASECRQLSRKLMNYIMHNIVGVLHKSGGSVEVHGGRVTMIHPAVE